MTKPIDYARLSLMDALDLAALVEEEAQDRYEEFAHQMEMHHTPEAARFFRLMQQNEARHGAALAARRLALFGDAPSQVHRSQLWEVEAPEYEGARAFMSLRQALEVVLAAETKARDFFAANLEHVKDADVRALFEELRLEECEHQDMVQAELAKLPPGPELDPEDFVDGPVAQ